MLRRSRHLRFATLSLLGALLGGFLFGTTVTSEYPCSPEDAASEPGAICSSFDKTIIHPSDLWSNVQGTRTEFITRFLAGFAVVFVVVLVLLLLVNTARAARTRHRSRPVRSS
jgi:hypothetical protein